MVKILQELRVGLLWDSFNTGLDSKMKWKFNTFLLGELPMSAKVINSAIARALMQMDELEWDLSVKRTTKDLEFFSPSAGTQREVSTLLTCCDIVTGVIQLLELRDPMGGRLPISRYEIH